MDTALLLKRLEREKAARKQAEAILESKAIELYRANEKLLQLNENLEKEIQIRSKELADSESRYRLLIEQASDIFFSIDPLGKFLYMNETGIHRFGYSEDEIIGHYFFEFIPTPFNEKLIVHYTDFINSDRLSDYVEFPIKSKDGEEFWMGQNVNRIISDGVTHFSAVARDITQRVAIESKLEKAQGALVKSEVKYRSVIENMQLGLLEVDTNGIILKSYDKFNEMLGYQSGELEGKSANDILTAKGFEEVISAQDETREKGVSGVYEMKIKKKNEEEIWVLISGTPFYNENEEVIGSIGIHYDITTEKNLNAEVEKARKAAVRAQKAEKQFLANMSHEIRTPLNAIIGMSHLISDTKLNDEQEEYIDILKSSAGILKNLISDILDMSKIDAGTLDIQEKEFNLERDVKRLVQSFLHRAKDKDITYEYHLDPKIKQSVVTDQQLLNQILLNLYSNADKFTERGSVAINIELLEETNGTYNLLFSVIDTGIGIDEKEAQIIFEEFKQAGQEIRTKYGGTGLGLAISKKLLKLLGSDIQVKSILGEGSNFFFELNVKKGDTLVELASENVTSSMSVFPNQSKKILVVEDNLLNVKYLTRLLQKWGIEYYVMSNGQEAVEFCMSSVVDLILMDLQMPILDGFEATKIIRNMDTEIAKVPIIALTASTFLSKKQMAEQAGMTDFLSKPFTPDQLNALLRKYLVSDILQVEENVSIRFNQQLDVEYLKSAYGEDVEYARDIFETFLDIIDDEMSTLASAYKSKDTETLKKQLHKTKPIFTMVGLSHISSIVETMETGLSRLDQSKVEEQYQKLIAEIQKYQPEIVRQLEYLKK